MISGIEHVIMRCMDLGDFLPNPMDWRKKILGGGCRIQQLGGLIDFNHSPYSMHLTNCCVEAFFSGLVGFFLLFGGVRYRRYVCLCQRIKSTCAQNQIYAIQ